MLLLASWTGADEGARWTPNSFAGIEKIRHRRVRNVRDYGLFERREAPQYHPAVTKAF
jgi:hypothetical protein